MHLDVYIENRRYPLALTPDEIAGAAELFARMDRDMDGGWRMGPDYVQSPDRVQRCQIAASRLLLALEAGQQAQTRAMAGYILSRLPRVRSVHIDTGGEPQHTELLNEAGEPVRD
jgi:hypothetical protein